MKKIFLACAAIVTVYGCAVLAIDPAFADIIYDEDHLFENLTVIFCLAALLPSFFLLAKAMIKKSGYRFWLLISSLLIIFIGDELSWGIGRISFLKMHKVLGINFDGVHDIISIDVSAVKYIRDYIKDLGLFDIRSIAIIAGTFAFIAIAAFLLLRLAVRKREKIYSFFSTNLKWEPFFFLFIGLILVAAAAVIDDDNLVGFPHKNAVEESAELLASVSFLFSAVAGFRRRKDV